MCLLFYNWYLKLIVYKQLWDGILTNFKFYTALLGTIWALLYLSNEFYSSVYFHLSSTHTHTHTHIYIYIYIHKCTHTYTYIHTHIHTNTLIHTQTHVYIYINIFLRGVENRRHIFFYVYYKVCFIRPYYSETKNKIGKGGAKWTFSNHTWFEAQGGREKKKMTTRNGIASQPLSTFYPSQLALNSWNELWWTYQPRVRLEESKKDPFGFWLAKWL